MKREHLSIIEQFSNQSILVIGEAMLDVYMGGRATRICREAPVPIVDVEDVKLVPGGAANTAVNVSQLGAQVEYLTVLGCDHEGELLKDSLMKHGVDTTETICDSRRQTITKQRIAAGDHLLVRFDTGSTEMVSAKHEQQIIDRLRERFHEVDAVVVSDYGYGILTDRVINEIKKLQAEKENILIVDAKSLDKYTTVGATAAKPNYQELITLLSITDPAPHGRRVKQLEQYSSKLLDKTGAKYVAATVDIEGVLIFQKGKVPYRTFSRPVENAKAAGAGDTYVSALTLALAARAPIELAADLAQAAALVTLQKSATATCSQDELMHHFNNTHKYIENRDELREHVGHLRDEGRRIVFTNGCFDILHSGHVNYLNQAKAQGDVLIVGVNSDASIKRLKGPQRPINNLKERARILSGLEAVDLIVSFNEDTPVHLIEIVEPDVYVKGGDYTRDTLPEVPVVEAHGGRVEIMPFVQEHSTTNLISRIKSL